MLPSGRLSEFVAETTNSELPNDEAATSEKIGPVGILVESD